jgi:hypothetical protein
MARQISIKDGYWIIFSGANQNTHVRLIVYKYIHEQWSNYLNAGFGEVRYLHDDKVTTYLHEIHQHTNENDLYYNSDEFQNQLRPIG